ncbi:hypothetical protein F8280_16570 [Micromonospora noduli]|uniref:SCO6045-like C-terminal domain-containing protein n=1 Tax=Micromonospora noduli TaxID=709876 RepID=A0ABX9CZ99_9ACTN|nr:hypothetical protein [Micromonospora noduli]KAB1923243.1 hypothetical protein F8280_16570 [Micromonospora noduli]RAO15346.1 hypothetical protein MED15_04110 [Micromonospora noduli]
MTGAPEGGSALTPRAGLAERQAELVAALVAGGEPPAGFAPGPLAATRAALLRKRAGEVARHWPLLAAGLGARWSTTFADWAARRPTAGSLRDGWDLARALHAQHALPPVAAEELAVREARLRYDGVRAPRPRRVPAVGRAGGAVAVQIAGRVRLLRPAPRVPTRAGDGIPNAAGSALWISD